MAFASIGVVLVTNLLLLWWKLTPKNASKYTSSSRNAFGSAWQTRDQRRCLNRCLLNPLPNAIFAFSRPFSLLGHNDIVVRWCASTQPTEVYWFSFIRTKSIFVRCEFRWPWRFFPLSVYNVIDCIWSYQSSECTVQTTSKTIIIYVISEIFIVFEAPVTHSVARSAFLLRRGNISFGTLWMKCNIRHPFVRCALQRANTKARIIEFRYSFPLPAYWMGANGRRWRRKTPSLARSILNDKSSVFENRSTLFHRCIGFQSMHTRLLHQMHTVE